VRKEKLDAIENTYLGIMGRSKQ